MADVTKKEMNDAIEALDEIGKKYPDFAARAIKSGNVLLYIRDQHEAGDKTAAEIVELFQSRGIIP